MCNGFCSCSETLHYASPASGGWGVVRIGMLVPESNQLFVCPFACGRHGAIGALQHGLKERISYLYLDQADIIEGYDHLILDAVPRYFDAIGYRPKALLVIVSCLDDLIGTDHDALVESLHEAHPDIDFQVCTMNPITTDSQSPPMVSIQRKIYGLLHPAEKRRRTVNSIGNLDVIDRRSELYDFLAFHGFDLQHISECDTYEAYQRMGESMLNLVTAPPGKFASKEMEDRLGIPYVFLPVSYRIDDIETSYRSLEDALGLPGTYDFSPWRRMAAEKIEEARLAVGSLPVFVDASATCRPYSLSRMLLENGFRVTRIFAQKCIPIEKDHERWLMEKHPDVQVLRPLHHDMVNRPISLPESVSIGMTGAYLSDSAYPVDVMGDAGLYGYWGISHLMERIVEMMKNPVDIRTMIDEHALVV
ncbi:MAG: nitrogenase component 1 [Sphaerochaetaceae bacterium]|jgi:nitrogenase molybdenum-cofactor synthesis protein NifE